MSKDGGAWSAFRELATCLYLDFLDSEYGVRVPCGLCADECEVEYGRQRIFDPDEGKTLAKELVLSLADRTANVSLILQCNVGVIAGYHLLAKP